MINISLVLDKDDPDYGESGICIHILSSDVVPRSGELVTVYKKGCMHTFKVVQVQYMFSKKEEERYALRKELLVMVDPWR